MTATATLTTRLELTLERIQTHTAATIGALKDALEADLAVTEAKADLEKARAYHLNGGLVEGRNAETREAHLAQLCEPQTNALAQAQRKAAAARYRVEAARLELDAARATRDSLHLLAALAGAKGA